MYVAAAAAAAALNGDARRINERTNLRTYMAEINVIFFSLETTQHDFSAKLCQCSAGRRLFS